ncbi:hemerythrin domain-containing protein [Ruegeria marina]|nr:hemerythrin domain-containing protein [Ruegeria marina]
MEDIAPSAASQDTDALIAHILTRYHAVHRSDLASLHPLAQKVETVHASDSEAPHGLAQALMTLWREMEDHMAKEEKILFPAMRAGGMPGIEHPIAVMRADHDDHAANIAHVRALTANLTPPDHACGSWRALYAGTEKLLDDLAVHIALENEVLFPRFERG